MIDGRFATPAQIYELVKTYALAESKALGLKDDPTEEEIRCIAEDESIVQACNGMMAQSLANTAGAAARAWFLRKKKSPPVVPVPPSMVISASTVSGASPLQVQFYSNASTPSGPMARLWDFGDGTSSTAANPLHTFTTTDPSEVFSVTCQGVNAGGSDTSDPIAITVTGTPTLIPPVAVATVDKYTGPAPLAVTFDGRGSINNSGGGALIYGWDFGNGDASFNALQVYTYTTPGTYRARLGVEDPNELTNFAPYIDIVVTPAVNLPPVAAASSDRTQGTAPLVVNFSSAGSYDPEGLGLTHQWTFGDGSPTSAAANPTHAYAATGTFQCVHRVSDGVTFSYAAPITITVTPAGAGRDYRTFTPSADSRVLYVSSSQGSDANDGLAPERPKASIAAAYALMRHQFPDFMLLRRGDSWGEALGHWKKSGRSASEPMVIGTYGNLIDPRPRLLCPVNGGFSRRGGGGSPARIDWVALDGLEITPANRAAGQATDSGVGWLGPGGGFYMQDCHVHGWAFNVSVENDGNGQPVGFDFFRNLIVDARPPGFPHSSGFYAFDVANLTIEENVLDHNGWSESVPGADPTIFNHNIYLQGGVDNVVIRNNISARASSHGASVNTQITIEGNAFIANAVGAFARTMGPAGTTVRQNVVTEGRDISPSEPRGVGLVFGPKFTESPDRPVGPLTIQQNLIFNNNTSDPGASAIEFVDKNGTTGPVVCTGNTVYNWRGPILVNNQSGSTADVALTGNVFSDSSTALVLSIRQAPVLARWTSSGNRYWSARPLNQWAEISEVVVPWATVMAAIGDTTAIVNPAPTFVDASRTVGSYAASLSLPASTVAFLGALRSQRRGDWRAALGAQSLTAYLRAGYVLA